MITGNCNFVCRCRASDMKDCKLQICIFFGGGREFLEFKRQKLDRKFDRKLIEAIM